MAELEYKFTNDALFIADGDSVDRISKVTGFAHAEIGNLRGVQP